MKLKLSNLEYVKKLVCKICNDPHLSLDQKSQFQCIPNWDSLCWLSLNLDLKHDYPNFNLIDQINEISTLEDLVTAIDNA